MSFSSELYVPFSSEFTPDLNLHIGLKLIVYIYEKDSYSSTNFAYIVSFYTKYLRSELIKLLGSQCVKCHNHHSDKLLIHHRFHDGEIDRDRYKNRNAFYNYYLDNPIEAKNNLELLCYKGHGKTHQETIVIESKTKKKLFQYKNNHKKYLAVKYSNA